MFTCTCLKCNAYLFIYYSVTAVSYCNVGQVAMHTVGGNVPSTKVKKTLLSKGTPKIHVPR
jgi:hypothetical protein